MGELQGLVEEAVRMPLLWKHPKEEQNLVDTNTNARKPKRERTIDWSRKPTEWEEQRDRERRRDYQALTTTKIKPEAEPTEANTAKVLMLALKLKSEPSVIGKVSSL